MWRMSLQTGESGNEVRFPVTFVAAGNQRTKVMLKANCGPDDDGLPCVTLMLEDEDLDRVSVLEHIRRDYPSHLRFCRRFPSAFWSTTISPWQSLKELYVERRYAMNKAEYHAAATIFVRGLDDDTRAALKSNALRHAKSGEQRPGRMSRLGLALHAFTTPPREVSSEDMERGLPIAVQFWTLRERCHACIDICGEIGEVLELTFFGLKTEEDDNAIITLVEDEDVDGLVQVTSSL